MTDNAIDNRFLDALTNFTDGIRVGYNRATKEKGGLQNEIYLDTFDPNKTRDKEYFETLMTDDLIHIHEQCCLDGDLQNAEVAYSILMSRSSYEYHTAIRRRAQERLDREDRMTSIFRNALGQQEKK